MFQEITIIGNLGRDPEMRYTPSGQPVTNFSVAAGGKYTNSEGVEVDKTLWFRVSAWGRQAEICNQYLTKGRKVMVKGELKGENGSPRVFARQDGTYGASFEIDAHRVLFLSAAGEAQEVQDEEPLALDI